MEMTGSQYIAAPPQAVWDGITDPEVLKDCIPGCSEMTGSAESGFEAVVTQKVGPVKATFRGAVSLSDVRPGEGCTLAGEGKGGPAGHARGSAKVTLTPEGDGTRLDYEVDAHVGGKLAQLGSRIIDGVAKKLADSFFQSFKARIEGAEAPDAVADAAAAPPEPGGDDPAKPPKKGFFRRLLA